jgi:hypothetical protein
MRDHPAVALLPGCGEKVAEGRMRGDPLRASSQPEIRPDAGEDGSLFVAAVGAV